MNRRQLCNSLLANLVPPSFGPIVSNRLFQILPQSVAKFEMSWMPRAIPQLAVADLQAALRISAGTGS